jgi:hypothetical protein
MKHKVANPDFFSHFFSLQSCFGGESRLLLIFLYADGLGTMALGHSDMQYDSWMGN